MHYYLVYCLPKWHWYHSENCQDVIKKLLPLLVSGLRHLWLLLLLILPRGYFFHWERNVQVRHILHMARDWTTSPSTCPWPGAGLDSNHWTHRPGFRHLFKTIPLCLGSTPSNHAFSYWHEDTLITLVFDKEKILTCPEVHYSSECERHRKGWLS